MNIDVERLFSEHGVQVAGPSDRHYRPGWIHVKCPFCTGNPGFHLGWNGRRFTCWRCGGLLTKDVLPMLVNVDFKELLREYGLDNRTEIVIDRREIVIDPPDAVPLPPGTRGLGRRHVRYLVSRGFDDPYALAETWNLRGTGMAGGDYSWRIIAPLFMYGELTSYIAADILRAGRVDKYRPCPKADERRPHKHSLYGYDLGPRDKCVVVEGCLDAWRLGPGAVATLGTSWTGDQAMLLSRYKRVFIYFDPEPAAKHKAEELGELLELMGTAAELVDGDTDPGDMPQDEADAMMKELLNKETER